MRFWDAKCFDSSTTDFRTNVQKERVKTVKNNVILKPVCKSLEKYVAIFEFQEVFFQYFGRGHDSLLILSDILRVKFLKKMSFFQVRIKIRDLLNLTVYSRLCKPPNLVIILCPLDKSLYQID